MVLLPPCGLYGAATLRPPPLGPGHGLTLPCGWNNAGAIWYDNYMVLMGSRDPSTHVVDVSKTVTALHQTGRDGNNAGHGRGHDNPANSFNEEKRVALSNGPSLYP